MRQEIELAVAGQRLRLDQVAVPLDLPGLIAPTSTAPPSQPRRWELEIGFGKGRYLLRRAEAEPAVGFVGIEIAGRYQRLAARRAARRGLSNLVLVRGEALYLLAAVLPAGFASAVHVYFPDPWPKNRHHKRRFLDQHHLDLVLSAMAPGGCLFFATDFLDFGEEVARILEGHPSLEVERRSGPWQDGSRTNYEAKYVAEGRPILRVTARLDTAHGVGVGAHSRRLLHPGAVLPAVVGPRAAELSPDLPSDGR
jgi:tRNA (guanine-N7-)-methyltransferase